MRSSGYPNTSYSDNEVCTINGVPRYPIVVNAFEVESQVTCVYDALIVEGVKYCGTTGPAGVVATSGTISWSSDGSVTRAGWEICFPPPPPPSPPNPPSPPPLPPSLPPSPIPPGSTYGNYSLEVRMSYYTDKRLYSPYALFSPFALDEVLSSLSSIDPLVSVSIAVIYPSPSSPPQPPSPFLPPSPPPPFFPPFTEPPGGGGSSYSYDGSADFCISPTPVLVVAYATTAFESSYVNFLSTIGDSCLNRCPASVDNDPNIDTGIQYTDGPPPITNKTTFQRCWPAFRPAPLS